MNGWIHVCPHPRYRLRSGVQAWTDLEEVLLTEPNLRTAGDAHAPELPQSWWWETSPAMKRHGSWIFAFRDLWELFKVSGFDPSPRRNMCHYARFRWVLDCNSEPCCPGGSGCPCNLELRVPFFDSPVPTDVWYGFRGGLRLPCLSPPLGSWTYCWRLKLYLWELRMLTPLECKFPK